MRKLQTDPDWQVLREIPLLMILQIPIEQCLVKSSMEEVVSDRTITYLLIQQGLPGYLLKFSAPALSMILDINILLQTLHLQIPIKIPMTSSDLSALQMITGKFLIAWHQKILSISHPHCQRKIFLGNALKSSIARQVYRTGGFFESINAEDSSIRKAIEILR